MRIKHVITSLATGGAEALVVNLSLKLAELGEDVEIVTLSDADGLPRRAALDYGLRVRDLGRDPRDPRTIARLAGAVAQADIVHVHLFPALYVGAIARIGQHRVYTEHSTHNKRREKAYLRPMERQMYRRYSRLIAISDGVRSSLEKHLADLSLATPVTVIPNAISDAFFKDQPEVKHRTNGPIRLLAVGTLDDRKNFASAISALAIVPGAEMDIVGSGPLFSSLKDQITRLGVGDRVRLLGHRDDVPLLLDTHDALLSTSRYEGFGLVAAEAMARGLPVLGPDVPGFRDVVSHGKSGLLFRPTLGSDQVVGSLIARLENDREYETLSRNAILSSSRFTMNRAARAHLEFYSTVLASAVG